MRKDLKFALRTLRRAPVFTGISVLSLALGIGANTAIFSLLRQVVLRGLPVRDAERLVLLHTDYNAPGSSLSDNSETVLSNPMYRDLRDHDSAFDATIARAGTRAAYGWAGNTDSAAVEIVSGNFFTALGIGAALGRTILPEDDGAPGAHPVVVLDHAFWATRFGASPAVLNATITLNGHPMTVIGVAAAHFHGIMPGRTPDIYVPIAMKREATPTWDALEDRRTRWLNVLARLKPGVSRAQAGAATNALYRSILETELAGIGQMRNERARLEFLNHRLEVRPASQGINGLRLQWEKPLDALMAMVALVLLIACVNVATLMLARASGRRREIAIRLAMGAGRGALIRQLLLEGLVLAAVGGAVGLLVASWSVDALIRLLPGSQAGNWLSSGIDLRLLLFTLLLSALCGLLFSLVPALAATRPDVADTLKNQASSVSTARGPARFRQGLVTAQLALSMLLLVGAGLFTTSLLHLTNVDLGFRPGRLLVFSVDATATRQGIAQANAFYRDLQSRLESIGEVAGVGAAADGPFSGGRRAGNLTIEGYQPKENESVGATEVSASPRFFRALGIPVREGREFNERDNAGAPKVVVINEAFAKRYFAGRDPIGRRLMEGESNHPVLDKEIVGVVADSRSEVRETPGETVYFPYEQWSRPSRLTYYVRAAGDDKSVAAAIRSTVASLDANVPVRNIKPLTVEIRESIYSDRLIALLAIAFGLLATLLAAIGLYGVVAYAVERRTPEIGVRIAMGAVPGDVIRMLLLEGGRTAGLGIAIGLVAAWLLSRYVQSQLFGLKAGDPVVFAAAAALLGGVAALAAFLPGRRASRINPVAALKYE